MTRSDQLQELNKRTAQLILVATPVGFHPGVRVVICQVREETRRRIPESELLGRPGGGWLICPPQRGEHGVGFLRGDIVPGTPIAKRSTELLVCRPAISPQRLATGCG